MGFVYYYERRYSVILFRLFLERTFPFSPSSYPFGIQESANGQESKTDLGDGREIYDLKAGIAQVLKIFVSRPQ
jgi:hypothetical protein